MHGANGRGPLLERDDETACVRHALAAAAAGEGRLVLVLGPGGVGKTSLLDLALDAAADTDVRVLRARGVALEREMPFGLVRALLGRAVRGEVSATGDDEAAAVGIASAVNGLYWRLVDLAEEQPVVVLVDDAHHADDASLRFLHFLARRLEGVAVSLVVAAREQRRGPGALSALAQIDGAVVLRPGRLSREAAARIVLARQPRADDEFVSACHAATGGNPLFLDELLKAVGAEGLSPTRDAVGRVRAIGPAPVSRSVALTLADLPQAATDLARALAILGESAPWPLAAALSGVPIDTALEMGARLADAGILGAGDEPGFVHPIVRAAIVAELLPAERALAHRRAARVLREAGVESSRIAGHLLEAPPDADTDVVAVLRDVARLAVERGSPASAVPFLRRALAEPPPPAERPAVLQELARSESAAGLPEGVARLAEVESVMPLGAPRARAALEHASALYAAGRFADCLAVLDAAQEALGDAEPALARELEAMWVGAAVWTGTSTDAVRGRIAAVLGRPDVGGTVERTLLANLAGMEMMRCENCERAVGLARRAWEDGEMLRHVGLGDPSLWAVTGALLNSGEIPAVERVLEQILVRARRVGAFDAHATANYVAACVAHARGRLPEAEAAVDVALDAHRDGWETFYPAALWVRVQCRLERGDVAGARATVNLDSTTEVYWAGSPVALALSAARADIALAEDRPGDALAHAEVQGRELEKIGCRNPLFFGWRACAAIACARLDRIVDAREHAAADLAAARTYGTPAAIGRALRVEAMLGRPKDAIAVLEAAVAELERAGDWGLDLARAYVDLGTALRAAGERVRARDVLRTGLDLATRSDATVLAARARDELIAVGGRPRRTELSGPGSLTPSERRVVDLAVEGRTNRQIAETLFVTRKAVEYHLANAYRKLDVRRRDQLAGALRGESLGRTP